MDSNGSGLVSFLFLFAVICIVVVGLGYTMITLNEGKPTTDSYGNAPSLAVNNTTGFVENVTAQASEGNQSWIWFGVLVVVVLVGGMALYAFLGRSGGGGRGRGW
jgi:flagellar basal body-associated protein FliL